MKSFVSSIILLAILIVSSIIHSYTIDKITANLISQNNAVTENIYNENYADALVYIDEFDSYINSKCTILSATLDHSILNKIDEYTSELKGYISEASKSDAIAISSALSTFIENIPKNYKLKIDNIL